MPPSPTPTSASRCTPATDHGTRAVTTLPNVDPPRRPMRIGELARHAGVTVQTVRYYERRGLLVAASRLASGYREYGADAIERLRFIRRAQELGFTLAEIADLLALRLARGTPASAVKARAQAKIADIDQRIRDLQRIRHALVHLAGRCRGGRGPVGDCPLLEALGSLDSEPLISSKETS